MSLLQIQRNIGFVSQRVGVNVLKINVPDMSRQSECGVHYTNHATAITRMFNSGVLENIIAENSGHRSTKALHCYERTSSQQQRADSKIISNHGGMFQPSATECHKASPEPCPVSKSVLGILHSPIHLLTHSLVAFITALLGKCITLWGERERVCVCSSLVLRPTRGMRTTCGPGYKARVCRMLSICMHMTVTEL